MGPPPGAKPAPTSNCDSHAFSRLAKRMSVASTSSLPIPLVRPRIREMVTTFRRARRTMKSGTAGMPVGPSGMPVEASSGWRRS
jgi:hypothetical protein